MNEFVKVIVAFVVVMGILLSIAAIVDSVGCESRWSKSGMASSWGPMQGCMIQLPDNSWIPAENYRDIK